MTWTDDDDRKLLIEFAEWLNLSVRTRVVTMGDIDQFLSKRKEERNT